jgi:hypothetical protein
MKFREPTKGRVRETVGFLKCNKFCSNSYLKMYRNQFRKTLKKDPHIKTKSNKEIDELLTFVNMDKRVDECKRTFCNPNCKKNGKTKKTPYICPSCKKYFTKVKKLGAITFCRYEDIYS